MSESFDLIVVGGGSGGIATARRAAKHGASVALIEQGPLGGTCVNVGCVPKKVMWHAAALAETFHDGEAYGFDVDGWRHDWPRLVANREHYIRRLNGIYQHNLDKDGIRILHGRGRLCSAHEVAVNGEVLRGEQLHVQVHVNLRPIPQEMLAGDYAADPAYREQFQNWVNQLWRQKDARLDHMQPRPQSQAQSAHYG